MGFTVTTRSALLMSLDTRLSPPIGMNGKSYLSIVLATLSTTVSCGICPHGQHRIIMSIITGGIHIVECRTIADSVLHSLSRIDKITLADDNAALFFTFVRLYAGESESQRDSVS